MRDAGMSAGPAPFGALVRRYRQAAALSQEALAERASLSVDAISVIERGKRGAPRPDTVALLAQAFGLGPEERAAFIAVAQAANAPAANVLSDHQRATPLTLPPLPMPLTTFIGRERELATVWERLMDPTTRLLTLTGPGGVGKTRLALEIARGLQDAGVGPFSDGVAFVSLAALTDPALVLPTVAHSLGLPETAGRNDREVLTTALARRRLLLVLDNLEQVAAVAPQLVEMLAAAPGVRVLATSRARLNVRGERIYATPPLRLPDRDVAWTPTVGDLLQVDAVRLFVERARDVAPDFGLREENAAQVAAICRRLDGLPLAIELAAARANLFSPRALLARLERRLPLLTGGMRDLPERQRTLRGAIAWSEALLTSEPRTLFNRLTVFAGGCTIEAAEVVCTDDGLAADEILDGVETLIDASLLQHDDMAPLDDDARVIMLETVREYGQERLEATGVAPAVRARHASYYLAFAERAMAALTKPEQTTWFTRLNAERDNLRVAFRWARDHNTGEEGLRAATALREFFVQYGLVREGRAWLEDLLALHRGDGRGESAEPAISTLIWARACNAAASLARDEDDYARAEALHQESLAAFEELGDIFAVAGVLNNLALVARHRGSYDQAAELHERSLTLYRSTGNAWGVALALGHLGVVNRLRGDVAQAEALLTESITISRATGHSMTAADGLVKLALVARDQGDLARAEALATDGLVELRGVGERQGTAHALYALGRVACDRGQLGRAGALYVESLRAFTTGGNRGYACSCLEGLARVVRLRGQLEAAVRFLAVAAAARATVGASLPPAERVAVEEDVVSLRAALGPTFDRIWGAGSALSPIDVVAEAEASIN